MKNSQQTGSYQGSLTLDDAGHKLVSAIPSRGTHLSPKAKHVESLLKEGLQRATKVEIKCLSEDNILPANTRVQEYWPSTGNIGTYVLVSKIN